MRTTMSRRAFARRAVLGALAAGGLAVGSPGARAADVPGGADWLAAVDPRLPLARLTLPGTHDTCSLYGGPLTQTQTLALPDQLAAGVRFLDIRCRAVDGVLAIHHGPVFQQIFFGDVLNQCQAFLAAHPGEALVMRVKQEYSTVPDTEFGALFADYQRRWPGLFRTEDRIPALGEARGRVVLLADNSGLPGIRWGGGRTDIEDDYDIGTIFDIDSRKWPEVSAHLTAARAATDPQRLFLTFTSSSGWGLWPRQAADAITPRLRGYLGGLDRSTRPVLGTVPMDFVTAELVRSLYALNFGA
ncbi:phosphatidylinositol-specific phospholipase C [Kitasatospora purpeofusca]|uniref:phosphatidylinositol-specific phospholipase C n=1 Tax=Kitasatospora purpeofusca TaxID=67352 RepID=UPI00056AA8CB|nr:phosphatidylinositol-specific phospholipase C [Kitasatospora purpeofusca]